MTFDPKNKADKAKLYLVLRALADVTPGASPLDFLDSAVGKPVIRGKDYINNVRKGDYASSIAQLTYDWLLSTHFDLAHRTAPDLFPDTPEQRWQKIVDQHAIRGKLRLILAGKELGIVERATAANQADVTIKLGQEFYFELEADEPGFALLFQGVRNAWYPIPLARDGAMQIELEPGINSLPQDISGRPDTLVENHDLGLHQFVVVESPTDTSGPRLANAINVWSKRNSKLQIVLVRVVK